MFYIYIASLAASLFGARYKVMVSPVFCREKALIRLLLYTQGAGAASNGQKRRDDGTGRKSSGRGRSSSSSSNGCHSHALLNSLCADKTDQKASIRKRCSTSCHPTRYIQPPSNTLACMAECWMGQDGSQAVPCHPLIHFFYCPGQL